MLKHKKITLTFLSALLSGSILSAQALAAPAAKKFPIKTQPAPTPKPQTLRLSLMDQGINDISRAMLMRLEYRHLLQTDSSLPEQGYVLDLSGQHMFNNHPAILEDLVKTEGYPNYTELNAGVGYRFQLFDVLGLVPQVHFRHMMANGPELSQHLTGIEPGLRLEYWLYPEVTKISIDYGFNVPFLHLANQESNVSPFTLSLNRLNLEMSYRLLDHIDMVAGFSWWQVPQQFGTGTITSRALSHISGFHVGIGKAF